MRHRIPSLGLLGALTGLAVALAIAALAVALSPPRPQPAATHDQLCALLGAIMDDNDSSAGLFGRVAHLYAEDRC